MALQAISKCLQHMGFHFSNSVTSLVMYNMDNDFIIFLIYVDDIFVTGNNTSLIQSIIDKLHSTFSLKDLEAMNFFLGMEVVRTSNTFYLIQSKYIFKLLEKVQLHETRPYTSPMQHEKVLSKYDGEILDVTLYRTVIRASQYCILTIPDIGYSVKVVSILPPA